jgi:hypothetical protein
MQFHPDGAIVPIIGYRAIGRTNIWGDAIVYAEPGEAFGD